MARVMASIGGDYGDTGKGERNYCLIHGLLVEDGLWQDKKYANHILDNPFKVIKSYRCLINITPFGTGNAGNNIYIINREKISTHLLPPGSLLTPYTINIMGSQKGANLEDLKAEIDDANSKRHEGSPKIIPGVNLFLDRYATITLPQDVELDKAVSGRLRGTLRGSGPCMARRRFRFDPRADDLFHLGNPEVRERIEKGIEMYNHFLKGYGASTYSTEETLDWLYKWRDRFGKDFVVDSERLVTDALANPGATIFVNGTQGIDLDADIGSIGRTVSYGVSPHDALKGSYIPLGMIRDVKFYIIKKAYVTRAGSGLMPGEFEGEIGEKLSRIGEEIGVTSGNIRRTGHDNWAETRYLVRKIGRGLTSQIITKVDVYGKFMEEEGPQKAIRGYRLPNGDEADHVSFPNDLKDVKIILSEPYYWGRFSEADKKKMIEKGWDALPEGLRDYLLRTTDFTGAPVSAISIGPYMEDTVTKGLYEETSGYIGHSIA